MKRYEVSGFGVMEYEEVASTNSLAEKLPLSELKDKQVILTWRQTQGRGQATNRWESAPGKNISMTVIFRPECLEAGKQFAVSMVIALGCLDFLSHYVEGVTVKWPNDIYWKDRKICGMLIENDLSGQHLYCSVIGIGLNINQEVFRSNAPNPVSLTQITGKTYNREELLNRFLRIFFNYYCLLLQEKEEEIRAAYMAALYRGDGYYPYADENGRFEARIHAIEPTGHLILLLRDGERRRYAFKEVTTVI